MSRVRRWVRKAIRARRTVGAIRETELGRRLAERVRSQVEATRTAFDEGHLGPEEARAAAEARRRDRLERGPRDPQLAEWYANLELPYGADLEAVTRAWKRLMARYHPDRHAGDRARDRQATELAQALNRAYEGLRRHLD